MLSNIYGLILGSCLEGAANMLKKIGFLSLDLFQNSTLLPLRCYPEPDSGSLLDAEIVLG